MLAVQGVDFCNETNGENHHTSKFNLMTRTEDKCLVVRRGQSFKLDILLNRPYATRDAVSFIFYVAGTKVVLVLNSTQRHAYFKTDRNNLMHYYIAQMLKSVGRLMIRRRRCHCWKKDRKLWEDGMLFTRVRWTIT